MRVLHAIMREQHTAGNTCVALASRTGEELPALVSGEVFTPKVISTMGWPAFWLSLKSVLCLGMASAGVVLPGSTWTTMATFRMSLRQDTCSTQPVSASGQGCTGSWQSV